MRTHGCCSTLLLQSGLSQAIGGNKLRLLLCDFRPIPSPHQLSTEFINSTTKHKSAQHQA